MSQIESPGQENKRYILPLAGLILFYAFVLYFTGWLSDDALITLRTIDNFVNGRGLTWNPNERVQAFTHPLWLFILTAFYSVSREPFYTTILSSLFISLSALILLSAANKDRPFLPLGLTILALSKAYVDYSTSGLENPLTHLLVVCFFILYFNERVRNRLFWLSLIFSLLFLTRMDYFLIFSPAIGLAFWKDRNWKSLIMGLLPIAIWELFSIIYFGFPFPNTAYAKLNTQILPLDLMTQGAQYVVNSIAWDPITLMTVFIGVYLSFSKKQSAYGSAAIGIILYLLYVIWIGGDFMSGRYFSVPLLITVILLSNQIKNLRYRNGLAMFMLVIALGLLSRTPNLLFWNQRQYLLNDPEFINKQGIADERMFYFDLSSLIYSNPDKHSECLNTSKLYARFESNGITFYEMSGGMGCVGYYGGVNAYVIDHYGIVDPLIARIPFTGNAWRPGHLYRGIPEGYTETLTSGKNRIKNDGLAEYYDHLKVIISGKVFDMNRFEEIAKMNLGLYENLIAQYVNRNN